MTSIDRNGIIAGGDTPVLLEARYQALYAAAFSTLVPLG